MKNLLSALAFLLLATGAFAQGGQAPSGNSPAPAPASGDVEAIMQSFGLTGGPWSANCSQPEGPSNWYGNFEVRNGKVTQVYTNGRGENRYEILQATKLANDRLRVRVHFTNRAGADEIQTLEWVVRGNRVRTFSNVSEKRGPIVTNGRVGDGDTPWVERCR